MATWCRITQRYAPFLILFFPLSYGSPTLLQLLLLWNAHLCLLRVARNEWARYVLKYTLKAEAVGPIVLDHSAALKLGLSCTDDITAAALTAMVVARPMSMAEVALHTLGIPEVSFSEAVTYVDSQPPAERNKIILSIWAKDSVRHPVTQYMARPGDLEDVTFASY
jgi:hypothetical protein